MNASTSASGSNDDKPSAGSAMPKSSNGFYDLKKKRKRKRKPRAGMRRETAYAHRNSASCTNTPGTRLVHMATGPPPQQPLKTQPQKRGVCKPLGFTTPRSSLPTITQQQKT